MPPRTTTGYSDPVGIDSVLFRMQLDMTDGTADICIGIGHVITGCTAMMNWYDCKTGIQKI